jgi:hypothetical protein
MFSTNRYLTSDTVDAGTLLKIYVLFSTNRYLTSDTVDAGTLLKIYVKIIFKNFPFSHFFFPFLPLSRFPVFSISRFSRFPFFKKKRRRPCFPPIDI